MTTIDLILIAISSGLISASVAMIAVFATMLIMGGSVRNENAK